MTAAEHSSKARPVTVCSKSEYSVHESHSVLVAHFEIHIESRIGLNMLSAGAVDEARRGPFYFLPRIQPSFEPMQSFHHTERLLLTNRRFFVASHVTKKADRCFSSWAQKASWMVSNTILSIAKLSGSVVVSSILSAALQQCSALVQNPRR